MIQLAAKPTVVDDESGITTEGLYYVKRNDRLVLMLWENNRLRMDGFIDCSPNFATDVERDVFITQWFSDRGIESTPPPHPEPQTTEKPADELPETGDPEPSAQDAPPAAGGDSEAAQ